MRRGPRKKGSNVSAVALDHLKAWVNEGMAIASLRAFHPYRQLFRLPRRTLLARADFSVPVSDLAEAGAN